jgi:hypothetical protein
MINRIATKKATRESVRREVVHELKCWPRFFDAIAEGRKRHDLRRSDDRDFQVGDRLLLREYDPATKVYTGREQTVEITFVTSAEKPCALSETALLSDFCILSIAVTDDS